MIEDGGGERTGLSGRHWTADWFGALAAWRIKSGSNLPGVAVVEAQRAEVAGASLASAIDLAVPLNLPRPVFHGVNRDVSFASASDRQVLARFEPVGGSVDVVEPSPESETVTLALTIAPFRRVAERECCAAGGSDGVDECASIPARREWSGTPFKSRSTTLDVTLSGVRVTSITN